MKATNKQMSRARLRSKGRQDPLRVLQIQLEYQRHELDVQRFEHQVRMEAPDIIQRHYDFESPHAHEIINHSNPEAI